MCNIYMYVCVYVCMYVCKYVCIHIYIYVYAYTHRYIEVSSYVHVYVAFLELLCPSSSKSAVAEEKPLPPEERKACPLALDLEFRD